MAVASAAFSGDPKLDALTLVDGVLVHPLAADSPAIDVGDGASCLAVDQRNAPRPQGNGCEAGAVEFDAPLNSSGKVVQQSVTASFNPTPQPCGAVAPINLTIHTITPTLRNDSATTTYFDLYMVLTELRYTASQGGNTPTICNADGGAGGASGHG